MWVTGTPVACAVERDQTMSDTTHVHHQPKRARGLKILTASFLFGVLALSGAGCRTLAHPVRYPAAIDWQSYEAGLARAKAEGKPVMLLFGADWCEPCHMLAENVLSDPRVIEASKGFVMIHVNVNQREDLDTKYRRGGSTLPRIYFLTADGVLLKAARQPRMCSPYGYDKKNPTSLLEGMAGARRLASDPATRPDEDPYELTPAKLAIKMAEVCTATISDDACTACISKQCCSESKECLQHAQSCVCDPLHPSAARKNLDACAKAHCDAACSGARPK
ncbi:Thioredoxin domain protein [Minicystis rosea]|nr:Thioredoxin domain protein [Minicystis rosea]